MLLSRLIVSAAIAAIFIGGFVFWFHEHYVLSISYGPSTVTIGEVYKGQEIPSGYQNYINYRYILGALFALATFSAVYF